MRCSQDENNERVLIYAPFGRDAAVMCEVLTERSMPAAVCETAGQLSAEIDRGAGAAILAADTMAQRDLDNLVQILSRQPPWSDIPLIVLFHGRDTAGTQNVWLKSLAKVGNLNLLERPLRIDALLNAVALGLRARRRQYEAKAYMCQLEETRVILELARQDAIRANEAKSRFLAAASHDLRQPFQAMRLFHQIVADALVDTPASLAALRLGDAITSGEDLLNALLDLSTLEAGVTKVEMADVDVSDVLHSVANDLGPVAANKGLDLRVHSRSHLRVRTDPVLLKRVVRNLAANAIRYTERGAILLCCRMRDKSVLVQVWDTGIGIPSANLDRIFEDFYQVSNSARDRAKGMGLGLSIVDRMARLLGHQVTVRSEPGRGTVFSVQVPRAAARGP